MKTNQTSYLKLQGPVSLSGSLEISGSKNSILPLLFATLLCEGEHVFLKAPLLKDVDEASKMLQSLGLKVKREKENLIIKNEGVSSFTPCQKSASQFRASILCLGPLLAVKKKAHLSPPGGCVIGARPIDFHIEGLKKMGASFKEKEEGIEAKGDLKATSLTLPFPSVGATENLIMASVFSEGTTKLQGVAKEPEIEDLILFLKERGAKIKQEGCQIEIEGVRKLQASKPYKLIPDRIEAGTWLLGSCLTRGELHLKNVRASHLKALLDKLKKTGFEIKESEKEIWLKKSSSLKAIDVKTGVYPEFPTDLQAQFVALMTSLEGSSSLEESIFENRFRYVKQLQKMGARIELKKNKVFVEGPRKLKGASLEASDLRAGASLILAACKAEGESLISGLDHINRGYENWLLKLKSLGVQALLE